MLHYYSQPIGEEGRKGGGGGEGKGREGSVWGWRGRKGGGEREGMGWEPSLDQLDGEIVPTCKATHMRAHQALDTHTHKLGTRRDM